MPIVRYLCAFVAMVLSSMTFTLDVYIKNSMWQRNPPLKVSYTVKQGDDYVTKNIFIKANDRKHIGKAEDFFTQEGYARITAALGSHNSPTFTDAFTVSYPENKAFKFFKGDLVVEVKRSNFGFGNTLVHTQTFIPHTIFFCIKNDSPQDLSFKIWQPVTMSRPNPVILSLKKGTTSARLPFDLLKDTTMQYRYLIEFTPSLSSGEPANHQKREFSISQTKAEKAANNGSDLLIRLYQNAQDKIKQESIGQEVTQIAPVIYKNNGLFARLLAKFKRSNKLHLVLMNNCNTNATFSLISPDKQIQVNELELPMNTPITKVLPIHDSELTGTYSIKYKTDDRTHETKSIVIAKDYLRGEKALGLMFFMHNKVLQFLQYDAESPYESAITRLLKNLWSKAPRVHRQRE